jgi:hypothetical protein
MIFVSRLFHWCTAGLLLALAAFALAGCSTPAAVLGHCELPATLTAKGTLPAPVAAGMGLEDQHKQWVQDRALAAANGKGWADTVNYVAGHCQGQN